MLQWTDCMAPETEISRRKALASAVGLSAVGLAGCTGDAGEDGSGNGGEQEVRVGTAGGGTGDSALAYERAMSQHADELGYSTIETQGNVASTYSLDEGAFDAIFTDRNAMFQAQTQAGPFEDAPVDTIPWQAFRAFPYIIFIVAREDADIETLEDLRGANFYPAQPGYSTRAMTLSIFEDPELEGLLDDMEIVDANVDDAPGLMEEGQIDASIAYGTPGIGMTGFVTQFDARVDLTFVEESPGLQTAAENYGGAGTGTAEVDSLQLENDFRVDEVWGWTFEVGVGIHHDTPNDVAYEMARIAHEHNETIREAEPRFDEVDSAEGLTSMAIEDYPWHPGIAEYLQDHDAWNDDWIIGEEPGEYFA